MKILANVKIAFGFQKSFMLYLGKHIVKIKKIVNLK